MKTINAVILSGIITLGAAPAFSGGHAERCMQAISILEQAQIDPFELAEIEMQSDPVPQLAGALFNGDIAAAEGFMDQIDQLGSMEEEDALLSDMGIDRDQFDTIMDETDPMPVIAGAFFNGDVAAAEDVLMALEATETDFGMCAEFMMPNGAGTMTEGMAPPPECMPAFDLAMQYNVDPMMIQMIERMGDDETAFVEEVAFTFFQEDTEAAAAFLNELKSIVEANNLSSEICMPPLPTNN